LAQAIAIVNLIYRNTELEKMIFLDSALEIDKVGTQFNGIQHGIRPAIPAANGDSIVDPGCSYAILVSAIPTNKY
jgi:hypothetical protein